MINGARVYFRIKGHTFSASFSENAKGSLDFVYELEKMGLKGGGTPEEKGVCVGCKEDGKYGIHVWGYMPGGKQKQSRLTKSELVEALKETS